MDSRIVSWPYFLAINWSIVTPRYGLTAFLRGRAADNRTAPRAWSPPGSSVLAMASGISIPEMNVTRLRNGSRGFVINENSKLEPSCCGLQYPGAAPCGCQIPMKRLTGAAAVLAKGVCAGTIESSRGKPSLMPAPRKNVRRGMNFFSINISFDSCSVTGSLFGFFRSHLKWGALDNAHQNRQEPVVILVRIPHNLPDHGHIFVFHSAA